MAAKKKILFVCLGNIVRSPLAEHMLKKLANEEGVGKYYQVDSAGTSAYHVGEAPDPRMRQVAAQYGLIYTGHSRQFKMRDFSAYDLIVPMDAANLHSLNRMANTPEDVKKIKMLRTFDPSNPKAMDVPDPYYGGMRGFESVYEMVESACRGLLEVLEVERLR